MTCVWSLRMSVCGLVSLDSAAAGASHPQDGEHEPDDPDWNPDLVRPRRRMNTYWMHPEGGSDAGR